MHRDAEHAHQPTVDSHQTGQRRCCLWWLGWGSMKAGAWRTYM